MIHTMYYYGDDTPATQLSRAQVSGALDDPAGVLWMDLDGFTDDEARGALAALGIGALGIDVSLTRGRRPRLDAFDNVMLMSTRWPVPVRKGSASAAHDTEEHADTTGQSATVDSAESALLPASSVLADTVGVGLFVGDNFVVSLHRKTVPQISKLRDEVATDTTILARGPDAVAALVLHSLAVDSTRIVADLARNATAIEGDLLHGAEGATVERYHVAVAQLRDVRRIVAPVAEAADRLSQADSPYVSHDNRTYFREVYDQLAANIELADDIEQRSGAVLTAHAASATTSLRADLRLMTVLQAVLLSAILLAAIFGMRFDNLPWMDEALGWTYVLGAMCAAGVAVAVTIALVYRWRR